MGVGMFIMYEGRMMPVEEVLRLKNSTEKKIIETIPEQPKEVIEAISEQPEEVIVDIPKDDELEKVRAEYKEIFGRKANHMAKVDTLKEKIAQASEA